MATSGSEPDLKRQAAHSAKWTAASTVMVTLIQVGQILILPRLVGAEDYGLVAMTLAFAGFAQTFADLGVSAAVIQRRDATREQLSSLYWLNVLTGLAFGALVVILGPAIAWFYDDPRVLPLIPLAAAPFAVIPFGQQFQMLLQKELQFRKIAPVEVVAASAGLVASVALAWLGGGAVAVLCGPLAAAFVRSGLYAWAGWQDHRPTLHFARSDLSGFVAFGAWQIGDRFVNYTTGRIDQFAIGVLLGAENLGYYNLATQYSALPMGRVNATFGAVAFPVFCKVQDDNPRLQRGYAQLLAIIMTINAPLMLGLAATAHLVVPLVAGPEWTPAVLPLQILSLVGLIRAQGNPVGALILAKGRTDLGFWWNIFVAVWMIPIVWASAAGWGVLGASLALLALQLFFLPGNYWYLVRGLIGPFLGAYLRAIARPVAAGAVMFAAVALAATQITDWPPAVALTSLVLLGAAVYGAMGLVLLRDEIAAFRQAIGR